MLLYPLPFLLHSSLVMSVSLKTNGFFISHFSVGGYQFSPTACLSPSHVYPTNPINYEYLCSGSISKETPIFSTRHWLMPNLHFWSSYGFVLFSISLFISFGFGILFLFLKIASISVGGYISHNYPIYDECQTHLAIITGSPRQLQRHPHTLWVLFTKDLDKLEQALIHSWGSPT